MKEALEKEMNAILAFLEKFCDSGLTTAIINAGEIAKNLDIDNTFAETRYRRKKQLFIVKMTMKIVTFMGR